MIKVNNVKFRAWDKKDRVIRDVVGMSFYHDSVSVDIEYGRYLQDGSSRFELMQFTGLKDENDNDIYVGDIIWDSHDGEYGKVIFDEGSFYAEWEVHIELLSEVHDVIDISGNIYENKELLEGD